MSDRKHMEYCVKLGNTFIQNKLQNLEDNNYIEPQINYNENYHKETMSFRERLRNWDM